jgi:16S rRNA (guanine527-N7)-methyltransferase
MRGSSVAKESSPDVPEGGLPDIVTVCRDATAMGVDLCEEQAARLLQFGALLLRWNRTFNLVSRKDQNRLYHRHLLDSLSVAPWLWGQRVMDLGTGAGLPGIPLAIASPDRSFTLVDRNERKIRLVGQVARSLALENVTAICGDVTALAAVEGFQRFDTVVTRAVAAAVEAWRLARPSLAEGGRLLLMAHGQADRGSSGSTAETVPADARIAGRELLTIPGLAQPHVLLILERARDAGDATSGI